MHFAVNVINKQNEINVSRVYVILRCEEGIEVTNYRVHDRDTPGDTDYVNIREEDDLLRQEITIADSLTIAPGETEFFEGSITIPDHLPPTFRGKYARMTWSLYAGLDMKGNDPDSGWVEIHIG